MKHHSKSCKVLPRFSIPLYTDRVKTKELSHFLSPFYPEALQHDLNQSKAGDQETFLHNFSSALVSPVNDFTLNQHKGREMDGGLHRKQVKCCAIGSQLRTMTAMCLLEQRMPFV